MLSNFKENFKNRELKKPGLYFKLVFIITGITSTIWFLIRVIPKPSRATYPCMRTVAPIMSSFIIYIIALSGSVLAFKNSKRLLVNKKYIAAFSLVIAGLASFLISQTTNPSVSQGAIVEQSALVPNVPVGVPYGIRPGAVVWVHNPDATRSELTNNSGDYWWMDKNTNPVIVQKMVDDGIKAVSNENTVKDAWLALFEYHDTKLGRDSIGYRKGDKIYIKPNLTRSWSDSGTNYESKGEQDASPQLLLAILKQLINEAGVDQKDITVGDPFRCFRNNYYAMLDGAFPNVTYMDNNGGNGRVQTVLTKDKLFNTSDGRFSGRIPQAYADAKYFINVACLKIHLEAGITLCAKNHQGSVMNDPNRSASIKVNLMSPELHYCYPTSTGYGTKGKYRHITDYMGHKYMGGNTVINIIDGFWPGGQSVGEDKPSKYYMAPFNGDYPSSIFMSQDRVAIEAVGYDFLLYEYSNYSSKHKNNKQPLLAAVPDYFEQAADPTNRPAGIQYDPENDGSKITESMGVYEHWNENHLYSQNLGTGNGILLVKIDKNGITDTLKTGNAQINNHLESFNCYPNPVVENLNMNYNFNVAGEHSADIINMKGEIVSHIKIGHRKAGAHTSSVNLGNELNQGNYVIRLNNSTKNGLLTQSTRIIVQ